MIQLHHCLELYDLQEMSPFIFFICSLILDLLIKTSCLSNFTGPVWKPSASTLESWVISFSKHLFCQALILALASPCCSLFNCCSGWLSMGEEATICMLTKFVKIYAFHVLVSHLVARQSPFSISCTWDSFYGVFSTFLKPPVLTSFPILFSTCPNQHFIKNVEATLNLSMIFLQHLPVSYWFISMEISFPVVGFNLLNLYSWCHFHTSFATKLHYLISQNPQ